MKILFFGSTTDSVIVLQKIATLKDVEIAAVVTQPPRPVGRDHTLTQTPVAVWATEHAIPVLSFPTDPQKPWIFANETQVIDTLQPIQADLLISASYGVKIPWSTISAARFGGINVHPSILPYWRGADPVPWAILSGDHQIGVTVVTLSENFDEGKILAQEKIPITPHDTSDPLRTTLFTMGAELLVNVLPDLFRGKLKPQASHRIHEKLPYAKKFTREDGFEPWESLQKALTDATEATRIERKYRALHPWPGIWTTIAEKRLKLLALHLDNGLLVLDEVQLEGKNPVSWKQFQTAYLP